MDTKTTEFVWGMNCELRKEIVESQRIRAQVIGFKITLVSTAIGFIAANIDQISSSTFVIPAFAAICFDFLITSYSFSIKRIGYYCREQLEPAIRPSLPQDFMLWEEFMATPAARQDLSFLGHCGVTFLVSVVAFVGLFYAPEPWPLRAALTAILIAFLCAGLYAFRMPFSFRKTSSSSIADTQD